MSVEAQQRFEISRLTSLVDQLQRSLRNSTSEIDNLRSSIMPVPGTCESEQLQALKAEVDHERQKAKAIWAAIRHIAGEDTVRRIEEEVSRRPIVAAPKVRRRGTMPHMPAPHMTVVTKTAVAPKWPPSAQEEPATPASEVVSAPFQAEPAEEVKSEFEVDIGSVPPSVARQLFGGAKGKDQKETATAIAEPISLTAKVDGTSAPPSARVAQVPSPLRRRESSTIFSSAPTLPRPNASEAQAELVRQKVSVRSSTPTAAAIPRRVSGDSGIQSWTPPSLQVRTESSTEANTTPMGSSVRDRIRQLELSARRNSCQN